MYQENNVANQNNRPLNELLRKEKQLQTPPKNIANQHQDQLQDLLYNQKQKQDKQITESTIVPQNQTLMLSLKSSYILPKGSVPICLNEFSNEELYYVESSQFIPLGNVPIQLNEFSNDELCHSEYDEIQEDYIYDYFENQYLYETLYST